MASEREEVLKSLTDTVHQVHASASVANLEKAISNAESTKQLELSQKHEMNRLLAELGWFGKIFGSESHAIIVIAFLVIVLSFGTAIWLWRLAYHSGKMDFWSSEAHFALAVATTALGYIFGRGSKGNSK